MDKAIQATPDEDALVLAARNRGKITKEIEFNNSSRMQLGYSYAVLKDNGDLTVDGLDIFHYAKRYSDSSIEYSYESIEMQLTHMRFDLFFNQVQEFNEVHGIPPLDRNKLCGSRVECADLLWEGR